ncbi:MAG: hypothetical protein ABF491_10170 [Acetobacter sp.]|uniref:hypothetical protein n=1 Tax=Acetobacter sp. TaxID=440 RepID=UPI0039E9DCBD
MENPCLSPVLVWRGRASALPASLCRDGASHALLSVSVAPEDTVRSVRERLVDELIRATAGAQARPEDHPALCRLFEPMAWHACPGMPADRADPGAPEPPLAAQPWQLAGDPQTYAERAGWWIVVDGSWNHELSDTVPCREQAQAIADRLNAADPGAEWYRHWFCVATPLPVLTTEALHVL